MKKACISVLVVAFLAVTVTSCYGPFKLTQNLHTWNGNATGDRFLNSLIFVGLCIVPVYEVCLFADAVVLNTVEFWSGSNPVAMKDGQVEKQIVKNASGTYAITATHNQFKAEVLAGKNKGEVSILRFNDVEQSWYLIENNKSTKLVSVNGSSTVGFLPSGQQVSFAGDVSQSDVQNTVNLSMEYAK